MSEHPRATRRAATRPSTDRMGRISALGLSSRTLRLVKSAGASTVGRLVKMTRADLLSNRGFGFGSLREVEDRLRMFGLFLSADASVAGPATALPASKTKELERKLQSVNAALANETSAHGACRTELDRVRTLLRQAEKDMSLVKDALSRTCVRAAYGSLPVPNQVEALVGRYDEFLHEKARRSTILTKWSAALKSAAPSGVNLIPAGLEWNEGEALESATATLGRLVSEAREGLRAELARKEQARADTTGRARLIFESAVTVFSRRAESISSANCVEEVAKMLDDSERLFGLQSEVKS